MKKLWCVVCFMMLEKLLLPVVMVKLVSTDLFLFITTMGMTSFGVLRGLLDNRSTLQIDGKKLYFYCVYSETPI